jgi:catechol-2,3-dioxygenase
MHIQELILHIRHVVDQQAFYCITLGLPLLDESTDSFTVQVGTTRLRFQKTQQEFMQTPTGAS